MVVRQTGQATLGAAQTRISKNAPCLDSVQIKLKALILSEFSSLYFIGTCASIIQSKVSFTAHRKFTSLLPVLQFSELHRSRISFSTERLQRSLSRELSAILPSLLVLPRIAPSEGRCRGENLEQRGRERFLPKKHQFYQ